MTASRRAAARLVWYLAGWFLASSPAPAGAEANSARAGIGGVDNGTILNGDGTGAASITIGSVPLALVKQARDQGGTVLPDSAAVVPGQQVYFVLLVDNPTGHPASDLRITDVLDEAQFSFVAGSIEECTVPTGSDDAAIWQGVWSAATDAVGAPDDLASAVDTGGLPGPDRVTIGAVPGQINTPFQASSGMIHAVRFQVTVN